MVYGLSFGVVAGVAQMRVRIDFSRRRRRPSAVVLLFLLAALVACGVAFNECYRAFDALQRKRDALSGAQLRARHTAPSVTAKQIEAMNGTIRQLNLPWSRLLDAIESKLSDQVALLALEPEATTRMLHLQAEARSAEDMIDFVEALDGDKRFTSVRLRRHEIVESDRNHPYRFQLEAVWARDL